MYKESLFELIRKEEVVIWAGAGLSLYAGFPSGKKLGEILLDNLSISEKENINVNLPLPNLAEEFYRIKNHNRNSLIRILNQTFIDKKPISTECHQNIALIPHFKTIITTNYDTLFENAYQQNGQLVYSVKHIPYLENGKTQIFKAHGDLQEPDSIIITYSDYNKFFKINSENGVYWTVIKERLSTNNVLFLGYNIEDPNVSIIFDKITDELGSNRKECFLVAPDLPPQKVNDLIRKGINYINSTAEVLISELLQNLKENTIADIEKGKTTADTFRHFLSNIDLLPELKAEKEGFKVKSIKGNNDKVEGKMNLTFKNDPVFIKELNDYVTGKKIGTFEIFGDKLINADFWYGGLKFPASEGIAKLEFKSCPKVNTSIDIRFEDGFEITDLPIKLYGSPSIIEIHAEFKNADLIVNLNLETLPETKVNFNYTHKEICNNVRDEIELFTFLKKLGEGEIFTVFAKSGEVFEKSFPIMKPLQDEGYFFLNYFNNLKKIEQYYKLRFSNISIHSVTDSVIKKVELLITVINGEKVEYDWNDELTLNLFDGYDENIEQLRQVNEINAPVVAHHKVEEIIDLHGHEINIGYKKVEFLESYVSNLQEIIDMKEDVVKMKSKCDKILISYTKEDDE